MKRLVVVSLTALASLVLAPSALSDRPVIQRTPVDLTVLDDVDCGFPVEVHVTGTDIGVISTVQGEVREFHAFAGGSATLTNLDTGTTITMNIAGPARITYGADGSATVVGTGPTLFFFLFQGNPGITWLSGRWILTVDAQGNQTFSYVGTTRDLCAELAA
jgi:hypothetical protein